MGGRAEFGFTDQTIFITGGGTGIGAGIARAFARANGNVIIAGRREEALRAVAADYPDRISYVRMDVTSLEERTRAIEFAQQLHGRIDVLINNAFSFAGGPVEAIESSSFASLLDVVLVGPFNLVQLALPSLEESRGTIINISSVAGRVAFNPPGGMSIYGASKAALSHLTRSLAVELGGRGIRVNAISPGPTKKRDDVSDEDAQSPNAPAALQTFVERTPLGRLGAPNDIGLVAMFLASDAAGWVTGQVIEASGGWSL